MSSFRSQLDRFAQRPSKPGADLRPAPAGAVESVQRQLDGAWPANPGRYSPPGSHQANPLRASHAAGPAIRPEPKSHPLANPQSTDLDLLQREVQLVRSELSKAMGRLSDSVSGEARATGAARAAEPPLAHAAEPPMAHAELATMAGELSKVREQGAVTASILEQIAGELLGLRGSLEALHQQPPSSGIDTSELAHSIANGYSDLGVRLEDTMGQLFANQQAIGAADGQRNQIGLLADHVSAIRDAIDALPVRFPISAVHDQLDHLTGSIETLVGRDNGSMAGYFGELNERLDEVTRALVTLSIGPGGNDMLDRVEARMASLAKAVDLMAADLRQASLSPPGGAEAFAGEIRSALIAIESHLANPPAPSGGSAELLASIEVQMHQLSQKLDNIPAMQNAAAQLSGDDTGVLARLEAIAGRLGRMDAATDGTGAASNPSQAIDLHFAQLNQRLDHALDARMAGQGPAVTPPELIEILHEIASRLETAKFDGAPATAEPGQLAKLGDQLANLSRQIEAAKANDFNFSPISARLDSIERQVALSRDLAIDVASQAAQRAVSMVGSSAGDAGAIGVLSQDLRNLEAATQTLTERNIETIDALRGTLAAMTARLGEIEEKIPDGTGFETAETAFRGNDDLQASIHSNGAAWRDASERLPEPIGDDAPGYLNGTQNGAAQMQHAELQPVGDAPALGMNDFPESVQDSMPESSTESGPNSQIAPQTEPEIDDVPLEPGSGAPDLAALVRRASEKRLSGAQGATPVSASDVIAAARRAAQAAAQEAAAIRRHQPGETEPKAAAFSLSSVVGLIGKRRKLIATASAIALLAAIAIPAASWFLERDPQSADAPAIEQPAEIAVNAGGQPGPDEKAKSAEGVQQQTGPVAIAGDASQASGAEEKIAGEGQSAPGNDQAREQANVQTGDPENLSRSAAAVNANFIETNEPAAGRALAGKAITQAPMPPEEAGNIVIRQAAASGNAAALFEIARRYTDGDIVERDLAEAAKWYGIAAEAGFAPAQYRLGNFHEKGHGVAVDLDKAASWYRKAAEQGNALAMHNLAVLLTSGLIGGKPDVETAIGWFTKAAGLGVKDSQVNLGILYTRGMGVRENLVEAYKWFAVAARGGDADAATKRDTLANAMRPDQLAEARGLAELWKPAGLNADANQAQTNPEWQALPARAANLSPKEMIARAQELLAKLGFEPGPADGVIGAKTRDAVKAFQKRAGLKVNGEINEDLISALAKDAA